jgi:hypothetical protein
MRKFLQVSGAASALMISSMFIGALAQGEELNPQPLPPGEKHVVKTPTTSGPGPDPASKVVKKPVSGPGPDPSTKGK